MWICVFKLRVLGEQTSHLLSNALFVLTLSGGGRYWQIDPPLLACERIVAWNEDAIELGEIYL